VFQNFSHRFRNLLGDSPHFGFANGFPGDCGKGLAGELFGFLG
jgi:hypothetical protein